MDARVVFDAIAASTVRRQAGPSQVQAPLFHGPSRPDALDDELNSLLEIWSFGRW
jgi:hypothetical protein